MPCGNMQFSVISISGKTMNDGIFDDWLNCELNDRVLKQVFRNITFQTDILLSG